MVDSHFAYRYYGPPTNAYSFTTMLTIMDCFTLCPAAFPIRDTSAGIILKVMFDSLMSTYGVPSVITRDNQFQPAFFQEFVKRDK